MNILNRIEFVLDNLRENKNMIVTTSLGLVLVVAILTTTITSTLSFKIEYVDSQVSNVGDIHFSAIKTPQSFSNTTLNSGTIALKRTILNNANSYNIADIVSYDQLTSLYMGGHIYNSMTGEESWPSPALGSINRSLLKEIAKSPNFRGRLPNNPNETIYIGAHTLNYPLEDWLKDLIQIGNTINITINAENNLTLSIVGIYSPENKGKAIYDQTFVKNPILIAGSFCSDHVSFQNLITTSLTGEIRVQVWSQFSLAITNKINFWNFKEIYSDIQYFSTRLYYIPDLLVHRYVSTDGVSYGPTYKLDLVEFDSLIDELNTITILSFFLMLPGLLITIFFAIFSSNMFLQQYKDHIDLIRLRGVSTTQLISVLVIENIISLIIAIFLGCGLGAFFTMLKSGLDSLFLVQIQLSDILLWGTIFAVGIIISRILGVKRLDIDTPLHSDSSSSFWQRNNIDILLLALGIIGNVFFFVFMFDPSFLLEFFPPGLLSILFFTFIIFIFIPFPFFLLFGGIMTLSRTIRPILSIIARKLWQRFGNLLSYAITNLVRQKEASTRIIFLFSLIFSLFLAMFTVPSVIHTNNVRNAYYTVGADCYYKNQWNSTLESILETDPNIQAVVPMEISELYVSSSVSFEAFVLFPGFLEVAYFEDDFCEKEKVKELQETPLSALVNTKYLEIFKNDLGDNITVFTEEGEVELIIVGVFHYWPKFMRIAPYEPNAPPKLVITNSTLTDLVSAGVVTSQIEEGVYIKLTTNAEIEQIEEKLGPSNLLFASKVVQATDELIIVRLLRFQVDVLFVLCCLTISTGILIFGYTQLRSRTRELAVERTLGMKLLQLARIFFYESLISLVFSLFLGMILGTVFATSLLSIWMMMLNPSMVPKPVFFFPWIEIFIQLGLVMSVGLVSSIFPAIFARKYEIKTSLKVI
ncbi:MAG: FtsX-like permease family protein [Candidatus Hodarchaeota archaeon]